jgi:hypothetical protein
MSTASALINRFRPHWRQWAPEAMANAPTGAGAFRRRAAGLCARSVDRGVTKRKPIRMPCP